MLGVSSDGSSNLVFADREGSTRAGLGVDSRGLGTFSLAERDEVGAREELLDTLQVEQSDSVDAAPAAAPKRRSGNR